MLSRSKCVVARLSSSRDVWLAWSLTKLSHCGRAKLSERDRLEANGRHERSALDARGHPRAKLTRVSTMPIHGIKVMYERRAQVLVKKLPRTHTRPLAAHSYFCFPSRRPPHRASQARGHGFPGRPVVGQR
ncbi:uncharacterized protein K452DRAFT_64471 [Aplosporella prunicola CBS 121167]|uniref:Uncharacterized protein n=1 Tax=Aplosporella prunicola CBS 121167 TaxID=1176127 RepID=A0A6A6B8U8_9PEZI|nr:uncharacterized protein K452DRAFT_64471 [Aplosporella prunicola CBS 121167]KAF2139715.1 hypothetical protein K452DRAFT_64471 [Aplosporella prunicola CBS 121167]